MGIAAWLHGLGLQQYEQAFCDNAIDAAVLPEFRRDQGRHPEVRDLLAAAFVKLRSFPTARKASRSFRLPRGIYGTYS